MDQSSLFLEGINLLMMGMGFVALFLTLLVGATTAMSKVTQRYFTVPAPVQSPKPVKKADDGELVAVLTAAIHHHNNKKYT